LNPTELSTDLLSRIEDAGLNASAPPQQRWVDGWLVRFSPGKAQRARCINAVAPGRLALSEKLAQCQTLYRSAGLRMIFRITPFSYPLNLDDWLAQRGYQRFDDTRVMVCRSLPRPPQEAAPDGTEFESVNSEAYAHIVGEFRGTGLAGRQAHAERLHYSPVPYQGTVLRAADGTVLACGQFAIEAELVGLYDVFTAPALRGRGLSRRLCAYLLGQAREQGARCAYLQVDADNHAARAVYRRLGFADGYAYHYRALPSAEA
jgi:ribosomal protein S18 acetylase RimI-like enzyme